MWGIPVMFDDFQHVNIWHLTCLTWTARFYIDVDQDLSGTISMDEYINYAASLNHGWDGNRFPRGCCRFTSLNHKDQGTQKDPPASTDCQGGREQKMVDHKQPEGTHEQ